MANLRQSQAAPPSEMVSSSSSPAPGSFFGYETVLSHQQASKNPSQQTLQSQYDPYDPYDPSYNSIQPPTSNQSIPPYNSNHPVEGHRQISQQQHLQQQQQQHHHHLQHHQLPQHPQHPHHQNLQHHPAPPPPPSAPPSAPPHSTAPPPSAPSSHSATASNLSFPYTTSIHHPNHPQHQIIRPGLPPSYSYDSGLPMHQPSDLSAPKRKLSTRADNTKLKTNRSVRHGPSNHNPKDELNQYIDFSPGPPKSSFTPLTLEKDLPSSTGPSSTGPSSTGLSSTGASSTKKSKPEFFLPLDNINVAPRLTEFSAFSDSSVAAYERMRIMEPDLGFDFLDDDTNFYHFQDNVTPMMKPPGTANGYFDSHSPPEGEKQTDNQPMDRLSSHFDFPTVTSAPVVTPTTAVAAAAAAATTTSTSTSTTTSNAAAAATAATSSDFSFTLNDNFDLPLFPDMSNIPYDQSPPTEDPVIDTSPRSPSVETAQPNALFALPRPQFERKNSNQSITSLSSTGSAKDSASTAASLSTATVSKKKRFPKGSICMVCEKYISRDMTRHMRIHDERGRFQCVYPKDMCNHKTGNFNRPYDYKKHLLHIHFEFDDPRGRAAHTLTDKLPMTGKCKACKQRFTANDWLEHHILSSSERCAFIE
ncbi:hypothetical protein CAAN1_01S07338 [[Candida] anglica]